ncbi:MAG: D-alanyl-D-alanine carboxypeptidase [Alphaproteobacteria bacterium]|nr:D-alanyl-D-alanine carboxypeptidase [Alphaproteobacteria bacterium]
MKKIFVFIIGFLSSVSYGADFTTKATSAILMDYDTGTVVFEKKGDELMAPASMSKLMTAYLLFDKIKKGQVSTEDTFRVSENAWKKGGSKSGSSTMFLEPNKKVKVVDLIQGIIVQSGNDACITVAENLSGTESAFAEEMTTKARELGLKKSTFKNSTGLPHKEHLMTPKELAELSRKLIHDFPEFYPIYSQKYFTYNGIKQGNRNPLLYSMNGQADGLKTGHTEKSGYGLVGSAKSKDGKRRMIMVINGLESMKDRASEAERLMSWGLREFDNYKIDLENEVKIPVWFGKKKTVKAVLEKDVLLTLKTEDKDKIKLKVSYSSPVEAPVKKGDALGILSISYPDGSNSKHILVAESGVNRLGYFGRMKETVKQWIKKMGVSK